MKSMGTTTEVEHKAGDEGGTHLEAGNDLH